MLAYIILFFSVAKIYLYNLLNLSGIENKDSLKWIYYTYMGKKYRMPLKKKSRGPSVRDDDLQIYFESEPEFEEEIRGPFGDYHGMLAELKNHYNLFVPPKNNWAHLFFGSNSIENRIYFKKLMESQQFRDFLVNLFVDMTSLSQKSFELLNDKYKNAIVEKFDQPVNLEYNFDKIKECIQILQIEEIDLIEFLKKDRVIDRLDKFLFDGTKENNVPIEKINDDEEEINFKY